MPQSRGLALEVRDRVDGIFRRRDSVNILPPHPRGKLVSISKKRTCKNGMLEVIENKGLILRLKAHWDAFGRGEAVVRGGLGRTNMEMIA
jgi:hypothetical protein